MSAKLAYATIQNLPALPALKPGELKRNIVRVTLFICLYMLKFVD